MNRSSQQNDATIIAADWPAATDAALLLAQLGWPTRIVADSPAALSSGGIDIIAPPTSIAQDWAGSGAMAVTGRAASPCRYPAGRPATIAHGAALAFELVTGAVIDGPALLGERAALMALSRHGQTSAGGGTRLIPAADGWWALNLARDADLVPALTQAPAGDDPWQQVSRWAHTLPLNRILDRTSTLGMAASGLGETTAPETPWRITITDAQTPGRDRPVVVNLGALWAGPLAANLLGLAGAEIIDVESLNRPDPTRLSSPEFHALLHDGHDHHSIDFADPDRLRTLLRDADIVIEASRPRALRSLGVAARSVLADGRARTWLRITGHRDPHRVAFGDDAAVAGGLIARDQGLPVFAGDAIADPLTGLLGALAVAATHSTTHTSIIDIAMADAAAYCATAASLEVQAATTDDVDIALPHIAHRAPPRQRTPMLGTHPH
jgi:hypothetical protein